MKTYVRLLLFIGLFAVTPWLMPSPVFAQACTPPISGDLTVSADCAFSGSANGVDSGSGENTATLTLNAGILTVSSNQTIGFGRIVLNGGVIALPTDNSSRLVAGAGVWYTDQDNDHYPEDTTAVTAASQPGANYKRKATMTAITLDCYPSPDAHPGQTAYFTVDRGDGSFDYDCDSTVTKARDSCSCSCGDGCGAAATCTVNQVVEAAACGTTGINAGPATCSRTNDLYGSCTSCAASGTTTTTMMCR